MVVCTAEAQAVWEVPTSGEEEEVGEGSMLRAVLSLSLPLSVPYTGEGRALLQAVPVQTHALAFHDAGGSDEAFLAQLRGVMADYRGR